MGGNATTCGVDCRAAMERVRGPTSGPGVSASAEGPLPDDSCSSSAELEDSPSSTTTIGGEAAEVEGPAPLPPPTTPVMNEDTEEEPLEPFDHGGQSSLLVECRIDRFRRGGDRPVER